MLNASLREKNQIQIAENFAELKDHKKVQSRQNKEIGRELVANQNFQGNLNDERETKAKYGVPIDINFVPAFSKTDKAVGVLNEIIVKFLHMNPFYDIK